MRAPLKTALASWAPSINIIIIIIIIIGGVKEMEVEWAGGRSTKRKGSRRAMQIADCI